MSPSKIWVDLAVRPRQYSVSNRGLFGALTRTVETTADRILRREHAAADHLGCRTLQPTLCLPVVRLASWTASGRSLVGGRHEFGRIADLPVTTLLLFFLFLSFSLSFFFFLFTSSILSALQPVRHERDAMVQRLVSISERNPRDKRNPVYSLSSVSAIRERDLLTRHEIFTYVCCVCLGSESINCNDDICVLWLVSFAHNCMVGS
ncbi:hypothetical protein P168DRAFT_186252 [Aspergillus campestris IBT 28561]|uniref:Uncharacterized protein n=1 Tax=Aspergillus campestris (strain IBT 28561) TaxID=1392248 RepID=A0A2I1CY61_ASPC2|nr:uncharacterized protein P168DRAFT_186252 [Aspergillus campestris IBT 28561]PKY02556.1 hypothetical protein P168DRAFT_186252 [Aspergillus campestris IBT 28561]